MTRTSVRSRPVIEQSDELGLRVVWLPGTSTFRVYRYDGRRSFDPSVSEVDAFTAYGDHLGHPPTTPQARRFARRWLENARKEAS